MAAAKSRKRRRKKRQRRREPDREDRRSLAVTVGWMLSALAALGAELAAMLAWAAAETLSGGPSASTASFSVPGVLWFVAAVSGAVCLLLTPLVYRFRAAPPPTPVTIAALLIASAPFVRAAIVLLVGAS